MPGLAALQQLQNDLIRKVLNQSVFVIDWGNPAVNISVATMFDPTSGDLIALPASGYKDMGYIDNGGAVFGRSITTSNVDSAQSITPTRSDITADTTTLALTPQETNQRTVSVYMGVGLTTLVAGTNGVLRLDKPAVPTLRYYSVLSLAVDETASGEIVICRWLPKATATAYADQTQAANSDNVVAWGVTLTGFKDDTLGFSESLIFGGAGFKARKTAMGF
jgi:hypothetical protein